MSEKEPTERVCGAVANVVYDWAGKGSGVCCVSCLMNIQLAAAKEHERVPFRIISTPPEDPPICKQLIPIPQKRADNDAQEA